MVENMYDLLRLFPHIHADCFNVNSLEDVYIKCILPKSFAVAVSLTYDQWFCEILNVLLLLSLLLLLTYLSLENVAFYSFLTRSLHEPIANHVLVYDNVVTNIGGHYNSYTGVFTAPQSGTYVFTFTVYCNAGGYVSLELITNSYTFDGVLCNAEGADWYRTASSTAVKQIDQGDVIFIRTYHNGTVSGDILSFINARTCFAGWFLF